MSDRLRFLKRDLTSASNLGKLDADGWGGETVALVGLANTRWVFFNTGRSEMQLKKQRPLSQKYAHLGRVLFGFLAISVFTSPLVAWQSAEVNGANLFPKSTNLYVEIGQPQTVVEKLVNHPLRKKIAKLEPVKQGLNAPAMKQFRIGLALLEARVGEKWLPAVKQLTQGGLFFGADLSTESVGLAFYSNDEALLKKTAGEVLGFIKQQGGAEAYEIKTYRKGKLALLDGLVIGRFGKWFLVSNQERFIRQMVDNLRDSVERGKEISGTLASSESFQKAKSKKSATGDLWAWVDLQVLRNAPNTDALFAGRTDNPAVELLFGGILEALEDAGFVSGNLEFNDEKLVIDTSLPFDTQSIRDAREFYFGNKALGQAPPFIEMPGLLGQVASYRDLGRWWLAKEDLFPEKVIADLSLTESQLSTFFGGADFGEEILGALQPGLMLVAKKQDYIAGVNPDIKLPAFALIGRLQNPQRETRFRISFNSFITLLNLSENGNMTQFDVQTMKQKDYRVTSATYLREDDADEGLIQYNFSPSIAFQDDYMIISSTEDFAHELAEATQKIESTQSSDSNTVMVLNSEAIKKQLELNREVLVAQSMMGNAKSRDEAEAELDLVLSMMQYAEQAKLDYRIEPNEMGITLQVDLQNAD
ncbi:MAG: hypothetical protein P8J33_10880 [Pirellulaceae bacterium]|nr:hypothetical protein [Pirellulaceae bacterium]